MKPRTLNVLKKLAHQRLSVLQQEMVQLQAEHSKWTQHIKQLNQESLNERGCAETLADGYFQNIAHQKKYCLAELAQLETQMDTLQKQVVEAWQKEEMLKMLAK